MLYPNTLSEISNNSNTGVEYEIALFYKLLKNNVSEQSEVLTAFSNRTDVSKIKSIISKTSTSIIEESLKNIGYKLIDVSFETQNDKVGPADIIMYVSNNRGENKRIGLSIKYANTCTLNVTGHKFVTESQITQLRKELPHYTDLYIKEMSQKYGDIKNWFRKRKPSTTTDQFIDLIRDAVILNWPNINNKTSLLSALFHNDSPVEFWVVTYGNKGYQLNTVPQTIDIRRVDDIKVDKYQTSYVAFYLDGVMIGRMQVKFNNGFIEKCKKKNPDIIYQEERISFGQPFSSWNFSVEK